MGAAVGNERRRRHRHRPGRLSYILGAVGPVTMPDGEMVTKDNVVELTESTAYSRFPTDQTARKKYLQDIANAVVKKMTGRIESPRKLLDALGKAVSERRIAVWSSSPADQKLLEETPLAHVIPDDPHRMPRSSSTISAETSSITIYERKIEYAADGCDGDTRMSTVTIRLDEHSCRINHCRITSPVRRAFFLRFRSRCRAAPC